MAVGLPSGETPFSSLNILPSSVSFASNKLSFKRSILGLACKLGEFFNKSYGFRRFEYQLTLSDKEDENIRLIYGKILAIQHQYNRGNVMQESLDELSHIMTAAEYDEDAMEALLQKHRLDLFAARLEQVLLDNSTLTEGFTTLPPRQDKVTDLIKNSITHYQQ